MRSTINTEEGGEDRQIPRHLPDASDEDVAAMCKRRQDQAKSCGIDVRTFAALCQMMPEEERGRLRDLCRSDLETARAGLQEASATRDRTAIHRHLHVIASLGETTGASRLSAQARRLQHALRADEPVNLEQAVHRIAELVTCACEFFASVRIGEDGRIG